MNQDCIFCKIVNGDIPSYKIYEDENVIAFLDVNPESNGHTLIVPKYHYQDIYDIKDETLQHILKCAKEIAIKITDRLHCNGFTLQQNNGDIQDVKHFHLHIKPYYAKQRSEVSLDEIHNDLN